ncbi:hypothetical protein R6Q59_028407 [Mikania micrantha]
MGTFLHIKQGSPIAIPKSFKPCPLYYNITQEPESTGLLKHTRYLNLSNTKTPCFHSPILRCRAALLAVAVSVNVTASALLDITTVTPLRCNFTINLLLVTHRNEGPSLCGINQQLTGSCLHLHLRRILIVLVTTYMSM